HHAVPLLLGDLEDPGARLDAHVVVEDVEAAIALDRGGHHRAAVRGAGDVGRPGRGVAALARDLLHGLLGALEDRVDAEHPGALARDPDRRRLAVAEARPAGAGP